MWYINPKIRKVLFQSVVHGKGKKTKFKYGANEDGSATGIGGRNRRNKIDDIVNDAVSGRKRK